jgi:hypothetical protein
MSLNNQAKALSIASLGFCVLPIAAGTKRPPKDFTWSQYRLHPVPESVIRKSFLDGEQIAIICGLVSNHLEVLDFDTQGTGDAPHFQEWVDRLSEYGHDDLLKKLRVASTPSGGFHVYYRCKGYVESNKKLAEAKELINGKDCLIETKGDGGYVLAPPSQGYSWLNGSFETISEITPEERSTLIAFAKSFHQKTMADVERFEKVTTYRGERPGDKYNETQDPRQLLEKHGWDCIGKSGKNEMWRRPGKKERAPSGTYRSDLNVFYCFSSNASPLVSGRGYSPFSLFVQLEHGGNASNAARGAAELLGMAKPSPSQPSSTPAPKLTATDADDLFDSKPIEEYDIEKPEFGIFGKYFRSGQMNIFDAPGGIGKTTILLKIIANGSKGYDDYHEQKMIPFRTLYFTTEDTGGDIHSAYKQMGGRDGCLELNSRVLDLRGDVIKGLKRKIETGGFKLVIFDPLITYMHGVSNINDPKAVNEYLAPLRAVAMETGACIINIRHFAKGAKFKEMEEMGSGTNQFRDSHRSQVVMCWHPEHKGMRCLFHTKGSLVTEMCEPFGWERGKSGFVWVYPSGMDLDAFSHKPTGTGK